MADISTATTVTAGLIAGGQVATGRPPEEVILWSFLGALAAVYLERSQNDGFSLSWVFGAFGMMFTSVISGIVGSALVQQGASSWAMTAPLAKVERWVFACIIAALIHKAGPVVWGLFKSRAKRAGGNDA